MFLQARNKSNNFTNYVDAFVYDEREFGLRLKSPGKIFEKMES